MAHRTLTWQCPVCASSDLRVFDHGFCPNCGQEREVESSGWANVGPDRFAGNDLNCCGRGWSADALFCGRCGDAFLEFEGEQNARQITDLGNTQLLASLGFESILANVAEPEVREDSEDPLNEDSDIGVIVWESTPRGPVPKVASAVTDDVHES
ncbi:MAG: hypothetical protein EP330_27750 [Deltaproteobacteria bacterium]|nr:MAG: hypothetical protein EP330_27750 [Deltaproteobacteria bacterium]